MKIVLFWTRSFILYLIDMTKLITDFKRTDLYFDTKIGLIGSSAMKRYRIQFADISKTGPKQMYRIFSFNFFFVFKQLF